MQHAIQHAALGALDYIPNLEYGREKITRMQRLPHLMTQQIYYRYSCVLCWSKLVSNSTGTNLAALRSIVWLESNR